MTLTARNAALAMVAWVFSSCSAADQPAWCSEVRAIVRGAAGPPPELGEAAFTVVGLRVCHGAG
jgi:hypothetical protein